MTRSSAPESGPGRRRHRPTPAQAQLWFLHRLDPASVAYNLAFCYRLRGKLDLAALSRALDAIIARHDALRSHFEEDGGAPTVVVERHGGFDLAVEDLAGDESALEVALAEHARCPFDLRGGPLYLFRLFRIDEHDHALACSFHHTVFDAWSSWVFAKELTDAYVGGGEAELEELEFQYADYAAARHKQLDSDRAKTDLEYWSKQLANTSALELPTDRPHSHRQTAPGRTIEIEIPRSAVAPMREIAKQQHATPFMVLLSAFAVLLERHCAPSDVVVGTPVADRMRKRSRPLIGLLLTTLALRCDLSGKPTFRELVDRVREMTLDAFRHGTTPLHQVVEAVAPTRTPGHNPLFQVLFVLHTSWTPLQLPNLDVEYTDLDPGAVKFDLSLALAESSGGLRARWEYDAELFEPETIVDLADCFSVLLESIAANPDAPIGRLPLMRPKAVAELRATHRGLRYLPYAKTPWLDDFAKQAARSPNAIAARDQSARLTYAELDRAVNRMAHYLMRRGVQAGDVVALCTERNLAMLTAMMALHRLRAAYLPIDPDLPPARIAFMQEDARVRAVIVSPVFEALFGEGIERIRPGVDRAQIEASPDDPIDADLEATDLAYLIYTSGSTGRPKGVRIGHGALANLLRSMRKRPGFQEGERLLALTTISFDISALELLLPIISGGVVVIAGREIATDAHRLAAAIERHDITVMQATPSTWSMLVAAGWPGRPELRILCGGEELPPSLADDLMARGKAVWNLYGPTETTIWSAVARVDAHTMEGHPPDAGVPLGNAIHNTELVILDANDQIVPVGVQGELHIGGLGLAEGYHRRPQLDAERFVDHPVGRLYRTGDLARARRGGTLEFLGRADFQVKIRGFRIELGEIEETVRNCPGVASAVVVAKPDPFGGQRLVAYVVPQGDKPVSRQQLREHLSQSLPPYMVPSVFAELDALPLTPNRKIDRNALPNPDPSPGATPSIERPRDHIEVALGQIWESLLGVSPIGINESFFDLGGHSLLALELAARIERAFAQALPLHQLFANPTVAQQAELIRARGGTVSWSALTPIKATGYRPPIFFVGSIGYAKALEHVLPPDQPMYGLNIFGLHDRLPSPRFSVGQVADAFISEMQMVQPTGPYYLASYCDDCKVALEMALRLETRTQVAMLAFIDTIWIEVTPSLKAAQWGRNIMSHGARWVRRQLRNRINMARRRITHARQRLQRYGSSNLPAGTDGDRALLVRYERALAEYDVQPYPGDLAVLLSSEFYVPNATGALAPMARGRVRILSVPGAHGTLFDTPHSQVLGDQLTRYARTCDRTTSARRGGVMPA